MNPDSRSRRFTSAHGIALVALFVALSGIAYASVSKNSVKSKHIVNGQIKNVDVKGQSLKGNRLKNDTVTGTQIDEDTVGTVDNADRVDGHHARSIRFSTAANSGDITVFDLGHLTVKANCSNAAEITLKFETDRSNSTVHLGGTESGGSYYQEDNDLDTGETAALDIPDRSRGTFTFYSPAGLSPLTNPGHTISGTFLAETGPGCLVAGNVLASTPSGLDIGFPRSNKGAEIAEEPGVAQGGDDG